MSDIAIRVEGLGKLYRIGGPQERHQTFREAITRTMTAPLRRVRDILRGQAASGLHEEIWALKDVSFEVKHGEVIGIIGRNGAGKSTLLKILSRITEPTTGCADVYGRVGALLEVGTGFHPELTGRENIYLNGAILGMSRRDIERKFDQIVDFAGVEKFIDTPVKHYSSDMGLRLGFAVAAHLEPEILVVDEVLAVGDAEFQRKCLGKMSEVAGQGRTVLFVSHNMAAVSNLCSRALWLLSGVVHRSGQVQEIIEAYLGQQTPIDSGQVDLGAHERSRADLTPIMQRVRLMGEQGPTTRFETMGSFGLEVECLLDPDVMRTASLGIVVKDMFDNRVFVSHFDQYGHYSVKEVGTVTFTASIERLPLLPGVYRMSLHLSDGTQDRDVLENALEFQIEWNYGISMKYPPRLNWGRTYVPVQWAASNGNQPR